MTSTFTDLSYLTRALKMPRARDVAATLAETARSEGWDPLEFLVKVLAEEVAARETHGGEHRVKAAHIPQVKTLDDFDFSHQRSVSRTQIAHLHQLDFPPAKPTTSSPSAHPAPARPTSPSPSASKPHGGATGSPSPPPPNGSPASPTPSEPAASPTNPNASDASPSSSSTNQAIPFDPDAASLFFSLISSRYERASLIVSSNKNFSAWAEIFGDAVAVAAMIDRLVHHAHIIVLKGDSYRLKGKTKEVMAAEQTR